MATKSREATLTKQGRWAEPEPPQLLLQDVIERRRGRASLRGSGRLGRYHSNLELGPGEVHKDGNLADVELKIDYAFSSFVLQGENEKLLLAPSKIKHATSTDFVISLVSDDFSRTSTAYVGKLRSNILGTKFTVYDSQPPSEAAILSKSCSNQSCSRTSPDSSRTIDSEKQGSKVA